MPAHVSLEDIVAAVLAPDWRRPGHGEAVFEHTDGTRLLVRHSAAKTSWATRKPSGAHWVMTRLSDAAIRREPDIHVLGHHPIWTCGDRDPARWRFYVIAAKMLPIHGTLSLPAATFLAQPVAAPGLLAAANRLRRAIRTVGMA